MRIVSFRDTCIIERANAGKDEWDNPLSPEVIYDGECLYQERGASYSRVFTSRNPTVFLPSVDVQVRINDGIKIKTEFGRDITSVVKNVRDINMPWAAGLQITEIELKQTQGD